MGPFGTQATKAPGQLLGGTFSAPYTSGTARRVAAPDYHDRHGRPSKELYAMMGLMVLQQMHNCTDQEAVEQLCF
jgi:hypothetical protein